MKVDVSDIEDFKEAIKSETEAELINIAHKGVEYAKKAGDYQNRTHNLRNAIGAAVVLDGKITEMYIPSNPGHEEARQKTKELLEDNSLKDGIAIADGMEYASYVESKGFDVIGSAAIKIEAMGKDLNNKN